MAVIALPTIRPAAHRKWLARLCLRYVNWCNRRRGMRFIHLFLTLREAPQTTSQDGIILQSMDSVGGIRVLLKLFNAAYCGAPDFVRAGWVQAMALQASKSFDPSLVWIACQDGQLVGFCMARIIDGKGRITGFGVLPACRRRGLGTLMMRHALAELWRRNVTQVGLSVAEFNEPSLNVCHRLGFRER